MCGRHLTAYWGSDGQPDSPLSLKNGFEKLLSMELGVLSYFTTNLFWFATSLSMLVTFFVGYKFTGMSDGGKMSQNLNFASFENKLKLLTAFLVSEIVLNLAFIFASSFFS
jgi:hypothetical protein